MRPPSTSPPPKPGAEREHHEVARHAAAACGRAPPRAPPPSRRCRRTPGRRGAAEHLAQGDVGERDVDRGDTRPVSNSTTDGNADPDGVELVAARPRRRSRRSDRSARRRRSARSARCRAHRAPLAQQRGRDLRPPRSSRRRAHRSAAAAWSSRTVSAPGATRLGEHRRGDVRGPGGAVAPNARCDRSRLAERRPRARATCAAARERGERQRHARHERLQPGLGHATTRRSRSASTACRETATAMWPSGPSPMSTRSKPGGGPARRAQHTLVVAGGHRRAALDCNPMADGLHARIREGIEQRLPRPSGNWRAHRRAPRSARRRTTASPRRTRPGRQRPRDGTGLGRGTARQHDAPAGPRAREDRVGAGAHGSCENEQLHQAHTTAATRRRALDDTPARRDGWTTCTARRSGSDDGLVVTKRRAGSMPASRSPSRPRTA